MNRKTFNAKHTFIRLRSVQELHFEVDQFITIGSPVGLFCALRGINPAKGRPLGSPAAGAMYPGCAPGGLPVCKRMYNVFHPYDPVACRIEPLIFGKESRRPQLVPYHRGSGYKLRAGLDATGESVTRTFAGVGTAVTSAFTFRFRRGGDDAVQAVRGPGARVACCTALEALAARASACPMPPTVDPAREHARAGGGAARPRAAVTLSADPGLPGAAR